MKTLIPALICLLLVVPCKARIITVDDDGPADFNNIQAAINDSNDGDIIEVKSGIYSGEGNRDIEFGGRTITVCSEDGPEDCIISIGASDRDSHTGFYVYGGPIIEESIIEGFTIKGGYVYQGGAIYCWQASLTVKNCIIAGNTAGFGGGIYCRSSNANIYNCLIAGNYGWDVAGGIYIRDSITTVTNCTIVENRSPYGGSTYWDSSSGGIANCIIWGNWYEQIVVIENSPDSITYSDVEDGWEGEGNIAVDPCFVDPGYWNNYEWIDGDYHLKSFGWRWDSLRQRWDYDDVTSRCIDAGNPGSPLRDELMSVPDDPCNIWGENIRINMGAYGGTAEASMPPYDWALLSDLTNDGTVNFDDFAGQANDWLKSESKQPGDLNRNGTVDTGDIGLLTEDWLGQTSWF